MEIILKETIDTLGEEGDLVKVKPGYARNYLLPQKKAVLATKANMTSLEQERAHIEARRKRQREQADDLAKKIAANTVIIAQRVGEENKLYGSVTPADIAQKLAELGIAVDKKAISLTNPIKTLGEHTVSVKVGYQTTAEIKVQVVAITTE